MAEQLAAPGVPAQRAGTIALAMPAGIEGALTLCRAAMGRCTTYENIHHLGDLSRLRWILYSDTGRDEIVLKKSWLDEAMITKEATVTLEDARGVIAAGEKKALEIGQPMNIALVDAGGNLQAHARMDGAWIGSIDISINKAFTSRAFDIETKALGESSQPGGQFYGIDASNHGRVMIFAGGVPLKRAGKVVGAVGVSGGAGTQDQAVAEAAAAAF